MDQTTDSGLSQNGIDRASRSVTVRNIGPTIDEIPIPILQAYAVLKRSFAHFSSPQLDESVVQVIGEACYELADGKLDIKCLPKIWKTSDGNHINKFVNNIIAERANQILQASNINKKVDPDADVNMEQNCIDTFTMAMNISVIFEMNKRLYPSLDGLKNSLHKKGENYNFQRFNDNADQINQHYVGFKKHEQNFYYLKISNQLDSDHNFVKWLNSFTGHQFKIFKGTFEEQQIFKRFFQLSNSLHLFCMDLMTIMDDIYNSCPLNQNLCEAIRMVTAETANNHMGLNLFISMIGNKVQILKPLVAKNLMRSIYIISDVCVSISNHVSHDVKPSMILPIPESPLLPIVKMCSSIAANINSNNKTKKKRGTQVGKNNAVHHHFVPAPAPQVLLAAAAAAPPPPPPPLPPPPQQQQQQLTEEQQIQRIIDDLKRP